MNQKTRLEAITFDLTESINDLLHEIKTMAEDLEKIKEIMNIKEY